MTATFRVELSEALFQQQVEELATRLGWKWMHIPRVGTAKGWRTQTKGALGKGWPDLVLVKGHRLLFVELKTDRGILSTEQKDVLGLLGECQKVEVYVWRPRDWALVLAVLSTLAGADSETGHPQEVSP